MPYEITRDAGDCDGYAVRKQGDTKVLGCHPTHDKAIRQMRALYAAERDGK